MRPALTQYIKFWAQDEEAPAVVGPKLDSRGRMQLATRRGLQEGFGVTEIDRDLPLLIGRLWKLTMVAVLSQQYSVAAASCMCCAMPSSAGGVPGIFENHSPRWCLAFLTALATVQALSSVSTCKSPSLKY